MDKLKEMLEQLLADAVNKEQENHNLKYYYAGAANALRVFKNNMAVIEVEAAEAKPAAEEAPAG